MSNRIEWVILQQLNWQDYISPDENFPRTVFYLLCYDIYYEVAFLFICDCCLFHLEFRNSTVVSQGKIKRHATGIDNFKKNTFFFHLTSIDVCY